VFVFFEIMIVYFVVVADRAGTTSFSRSFLSLHVMYKVYELKNVCIYIAQLRYGNNKRKTMAGINQRTTGGSTHM
jgi:hypothetical protein